MTTSTIEDLLIAAEPTAPAPLAGLVERLTRDGQVRGARLDDRAIGPAGIRDVSINGVTHDSREVRSGGLFVAIPGAHLDGHDFVAGAEAAGAAAAVVGHPVAGVGLPQLIVDDPRHVLATAAAWWYGDPSRELAVVGITGTDGKTTTATLAAAALEAAGIRTGMTGTAETRIGGVQAGNQEHATTPEAPALQRALRAMVGSGDRAAVLETTSHGLALARVDAIAFDVAILTNLTHEHLELHGTWEAYRDAKLRLFERLGQRAAPAPDGPATQQPAWPSTGIVNLDDPSAGIFIGVARNSAHAS